MALTQCAIFYWTSTGILTGKLLADDDSQYDTLINQGFPTPLSPSGGIQLLPPGMSFFMTPLVQNPKQMGCPDDDTCRQLIAKQRGLPVLTADDERAAQVDAAGNVLAVLMACPENVQPKDLGLAADHAFVKAHPAAIEGDLYSKGVFSRRYVIADKTTNQVQSIVTVQLGQAPSASASQYATPSLTAQPGDTLPPQKTATATIAPSA